MEALYHEYADPLLQHVRRLATGRRLPGSLVEAKDVVHEAFLSMADSSQTIKDPRAWLFSVAGNLVRDVAKRHQHRRVDGDPNDLLDTRALRWSSVASQASAEDRYELRRLLAALEELPNRQGQAVYLHRVVGLRYEEIAGILDIDQKTVGVHVHRGTKRLRMREGSAANFEKLKMIIGIIATGIAAIFIAALGGDAGIAAAIFSPLRRRDVEDFRDKEERQSGQGGTTGNDHASSQEATQSESQPLRALSISSPPPSARRRRSTTTRSRRTQKKRVQRHRRQRRHRQ